jgi:hypothetical protein
MSDDEVVTIAADEIKKRTLSISKSEIVICTELPQNTFFEIINKYFPYYVFDSKRVVKVMGHHPQTSSHRFVWNGFVLVALLAVTLQEQTLY